MAVYCIFLKRTVLSFNYLKIAFIIFRKFFLWEVDHMDNKMCFKMDDNKGNTPK